MGQTLGRAVGRSGDAWRACTLAVLAILFTILAPSTASAAPTCSATLSFSALNTSQTVNIQSCSTYYNPATGDTFSPNRWSGLARSLGERMRSSTFCQIGAIGVQSSGACDPNPTTVTTSNATYSFSADLMGNDTFTITLVSKTATPAVTDTLTLYSFVGAATATTAQARSNTAYTFTFNLPDTGTAAPPTVTGLSPNTGTAAGGGVVTVTGTNFTGATAVKFGSASASFTIVSATSIQATVPAGTVGTVDVIVTTPGGTSATGAADQFTYTAAAPTLSGLSPASGPAAGGTAVTLTGTDLTGATAVSFGGAPATSFSVGSSTAISAVAPAHAPGPVSIAVTTPGGTATLASGFTYAVPAPVAGPVSATVAANSSANPISLSLSGGAATSVAIASQAAHGMATASGMTITYTPAPGYFGSDSFTYTATNASGPSAPATVTLTVTPGMPSLSGASPASGPAAGGTAVTLTGLNLSGATAVSFGGTPATGFSVGSSTAISAVAPAHAPGPVSIAVTTPGGTATLASGFTYAVPAPVAGPVSATVAANSSANPISLSLSGGAATSVAVASQAAHGTATASGTAITYTPAPGYFGSDSFTYTAANASGPSAPTTVTLTVTPGTPSLSGLSPASGPTAGGTAVTLTGLNLSGATAVSFGGTPATSFSVASPTAISAVAPAHAAGAVSIAVTTPGGTATLASGFTYAVPAPVAGPVSATVAANSSANPISLSLSGGAATSVAVASQAAHGTATASGMTITYTPAPGYSGSDSFTYTATNASGPSAPATVTLTVTPPTFSLTPNAGALPAATAGTPYRQALAVSGGTPPYAYSVTAGALPAGVTIDAATGGLSGTPIVAGTASFTVTVTDAYRFAGSAAYTLVVARPTLALTPVAGALPGAIVGTLYSQSFTATGGTAPYTYTISAGSLPAGLALDAATGALAGTPGQAATASFTVTGTDATGATGAAAYTIAVKTPTVAAVSSSTTVVAGTASTVDLTAGATGGPFTDARLLSLSPASAGSALIILGETAAADDLVVAQLVQARRYRLKFTPSPTFSGRAVATFTLSNSAGTSLPATVTFVVAPRPDPSKDAEVLGLMNAQAQAARRFATDQMANFNDRLERLHDADCHASAWGISVGDSRSLSTRNDAAELARAGNAPIPGSTVRAPGSPGTGLTDPRDLSQFADPMRTSAREGSMRSADDEAGRADPFRSPSGSGCYGDAPASGSVAFWSSGFVNFGSMDLGNGRGFDFTASSISLGADYRFGADFTAGLGFGFGNDQSRVGTNGTRSDGRSYSATLYGSYHPTRTTFLDALAGYGRLGFDSRRYLTADPSSDLAAGKRDGQQVFGSVTAGYEYRNREFGFLVSPYARFSASLSTLDGFTETGVSSFGLRYGLQTVSTLTSFLGLRGAYDVPLSWGVVTPRLRVEYGHDFAGASSLGLGYADQTGLGDRLVTTPTGRDYLNLGLGSDVQIGDAWTVGLDYRTAFGQIKMQSHAFGIRVGARF
ncbi:IPT/TIG domain-containing protein [Methylorubrum zatmanii]